MKRPDKFTSEEMERIDKVASSFIGKQISKRNIKSLQREFKRHTVGSVEFMVYKRRKELAARPIPRAAVYNPVSFEDLMATMGKLANDYVTMKKENEELREIKTIMDNYKRGRK